MTGRRRQVVLLDGGGRHTRLVLASAMGPALAGFLVLWSIGPALAQPTEGSAPPSTVVASADVVRRIEAGESIDLTNVRLQGDLDLRAIGTVARPLRCHGCHLAGSLKASDVVFERIVVFGGSTFEGAVELRGAVFEDRALFDSARFEGDVELDSARFVGDVALSGASFADISAEGVKFEGRANFVQARLEGISRFDGAIFAGDANFLLADFLQKAHFEGAVFDGPGSFRAARLHDGGEFNRVASARLLDFDAALLEGDVSLSSITTSGTVSIVGVILIGRPVLLMEQLSIQTLLMDVATVSHIRGQGAQQRVLRLIEEGAKRRGSLALANDARYRLLSLQRANATWLPRVVDGVFYRGLAGYLVRPLHPLVAIAALLGAGTIARSVMSRWPGRRETEADRGRSPARAALERREWGQRALLRVEKGVALVLRSFAASVATAVRPKPRPEIGVDQSERVGSYLLAGVRWAEFLTYKVLLAVLLLALGNSYATVREIIDAVRG